jgi:Tfp pilus assembly protein PilN
MALVLLVYLLFAGYLIFTLPSNAMPIRFTSTIAEQQVRTDALPQLQSDFRSAISYVAELQRDRIELVVVCFVTSVAVVGFLGWSIFVVNRIKREVDHVA